METPNERNTATLTHLSALSQFFIPFGNFIFPILIWSTKKDKSEFVNHHGKQELNFQLSLLMYTLILWAIAIPIFIFTFLQNMSFTTFINENDLSFTDLNLGDNIGIITFGIIALLLYGLLRVAELFLIIYASIKASNGEKYNYPLTIRFIK
jgi:uncharacterized Tic20 family protein